MNPFKFCLIIPFTLVAGNETWETATDPVRTGIKLGAGQNSLENEPHKNATIKQQGETIKVQADTIHGYAQGLQENASATKELAKATAENGQILKTIQVTGAIACTVYVIKSGAELYMLIQQQANPDPGSQVSKQNEAKEMELIAAQNKLNKCLAYNGSGSREANGLPCACCEVGRVFAATAGQEKLDRVIRAFERNNPKDLP